jgi:hypothetical protein
MVQIWLKLALPSLRQSKCAGDPRACSLAAKGFVMGGRNVKKTKSETDKLNAQQRAQRLHLYGLVQSLSYVVRLSDFKTAQHLSLTQFCALSAGGPLRF